MDSLCNTRKQEESGARQAKTGEFFQKMENVHPGRLQAGGPDGNSRQNSNINLCTDDFKLFGKRSPHWFIMNPHFKTAELLQDG